MKLFNMIAWGLAGAAVYNFGRRVADEYHSTEGNHASGIDTFGEKSPSVESPNRFGGSQTTVSPSVRP